MSVRLRPSLGAGYTRPVDYEGDYKLAIISLSFQVICAENYYGPDCGTYCRLMDDDPGHYTCCSEGNQATNCTECVTAPNCCELATCMTLHSQQMAIVPDFLTRT